MLDTYDNLVDSVVRWSHRKDILLMIPDFIMLAEYEMYNNAQTQLMTREMETIEVLTTSEKLIDLPENFEKMRSITLISGGDSLTIKYQAPEELQRRSGSARPVFYTIIGNQIEFNCVPDAYYDLSITFYKKPCALTETNQTNSVLTGYPNIYLYGVLHQVFLWSEDTKNQLNMRLSFKTQLKALTKQIKKHDTAQHQPCGLRGLLPNVSNDTI